MTTLFDIVVAGIACLTAGMTAARLGRKTLVLTGDVLGGDLLGIERPKLVPGEAAASGEMRRRRMNGSMPASRTRT